MNTSLIFALAAVLAGGILNGSFVAPMKKLRGWRWEHGWFVYSVSGLILIPWIAAVTTVPSLGEVFQTAPAGALRQVLLFGFGWGIGSVLFGLGVDRLGLAVGYGLILGLIAPIGTFLPLLVLHPERLLTAQGVSLLAGTAIVLAGIVLLALAGRLRERASPEAALRAALPAKGFVAGIVICVLAGIFSPMLNFAFVFGEPVRDAAAAMGASPGNAANAVWALTLTAGFIANAGYALWLLKANKTWKLFQEHAGANLLWASLMGLLCFGSFLVYGFGASALGPLGGIVGWPLFMSMSLITSNSLGALSGEWRGAPARAVRLSVLGIATLIVAIVVIATGNRS
jgi:L-rhamnose-H+ transport protein